MTYWNNDGKHQAIADRLESYGDDKPDLWKHVCGVYYDLFNNGGCNLQMPFYSHSCNVIRTWLGANGHGELADKFETHLLDFCHLEDTEELDDCMSCNGSGEDSTEDDEECCECGGTGQEMVLNHATNDIDEHSDEWQEVIEDVADVFALHCKEFEPEPS